MSSKPWVTSVKTQKKFFEKTLECFTEEDSTFRPQDDMYSVAATVAHVGHTYEWFVAGMFGDGFDLDFEKQIAAAKEVTSLETARAMLDAAVQRTVDTLGGKTTEEMMAPLPEGPIMGGVPKIAVIEAMCDHTCHHRGALAVYARLLDKTPAMPYA